MKYQLDVVIKVKCSDCAWSQLKDEVVAMTPCHHCNSTGYVLEALIEDEQGLGGGIVKDARVGEWVKTGRPVELELTSP